MLLQMFFLGYHLSLNVTYGIFPLQNCLIFKSQFINLFFIMSRHQAILLLMKLNAQELYHIQRVC